MIVIFLHGPPASGKYTVGKALGALLGVPLFHNLAPEFPILCTTIERVVYKIGASSGVLAPASAYLERLALPRYFHWRVNDLRPLLAA